MQGEYHSSVHKLKLRTELPEAQESWMLNTSEILVVFKIEMQAATLIKY